MTDTPCDIVTINVTFAVDDSEQLLETARYLVWNKYNCDLEELYPDNTLAGAVAECLLHSNPEYDGPSVFGLTIMDQSLEQILQ